MVCLISGGNNDVSRYGEMLERSLVHLGLKHYFLVDFPQEPGALRRFLDECSAPTTTSRCSSTSSATTGRPARRWSASRLGSAADFDGLLATDAPPRCRSRLLEPGSAAYRYLT